MDWRKACAACGLAPCLCLVAGEFAEAIRLESQERRTVIVAGATRPVADHTHREQSGYIRIQLSRPTSVATTSSGPMFNNTLHVANTVTVLRYDALSAAPAAYAWQSFGPNQGVRTTST